MNAYKRKWLFTEVSGRQWIYPSTVRHIYIASRRSPEIFLGRPMRAGWFTPRERGRSNVQRDSAGGLKDGWSTAWIHLKARPRNSTQSILNDVYPAAPLSVAPTGDEGNHSFLSPLWGSISIREIGKLSHTPKCLLACRWLRDNPSLTNSPNFRRVSSPLNKSDVGKHIMENIWP